MKFIEAVHQTGVDAQRRYSIPLFTKILSPAIDLIHRPTLLLYDTYCYERMTRNVEYLLPEI